MFDEYKNVKPDRTLTWLVTRWWFWLLLIALIAVVSSWAFGWIVLPWQKGSAGNVEKQFTYGYTQYRSLEATARQVCTAEKAVANATTNDEKTQRNTQLMGYENNYARLAGEYDAWASNIFQGNVIRPSDLPLRAPTLEDLKTRVCGQ